MFLSLDHLGYPTRNKLPSYFLSVTSRPSLALDSATSINYQPRVHFREAFFNLKFKEMLSSPSSRYSGMSGEHLRELEFSDI